ncbi:hypothetical protein KAH94_04465, partial [bacterium]|nr:hypothetical protein [bacterium]
MKFFKIFIKLILSLVFGGLVTLFLLQNDPIITKKITNHLRPYVENFFKGNVTFDIKKIQILPIKLTFKNIVTKPTIGDDWSWT